MVLEGGVNPVWTLDNMLGTLWPIVKAIGNAKKGEVNPRWVLDEAYKNTNVEGSSTACILTLKNNADDVSDFHVNTHIPIVIASQMHYEVTGDSLYKCISWVCGISWVYVFSAASRCDSAMFLLVLEAVF
ncbi:hypothetical protein RHGRI_017209 [Rhododendron griersonianum]|uniref:Uncharacterized protein n=1 Tax=Rhododendron griersonianum TaxID=479676 RepID=A0AAV6JWY1_9ERIC|nr:hypothetical protein RHGRI_017209 [Rhododendron griersonianum]